MESILYDDDNVCLIRDDELPCSYTIYSKHARRGFRGYDSYNLYVKTNHYHVEIKQTVVNFIDKHNHNHTLLKIHSLSGDIQEPNEIRRSISEYEEHTHRRKQQQPQEVKIEPTKDNKSEKRTLTPRDPNWKLR